MDNIFGVIRHATMITGFVFTMMLIIEYINVQTQGLWQKHLTKSRWKQYLLAAVLGAIPGCLGAYVAVTLFSHNLITFGAIVTAMIATSGDEAFVMFAMVPKTALILTFLILIIGIIAGYLTDTFYKPENSSIYLNKNHFALHKEEKCNCFPTKGVFQYLKNPSTPRVLLIGLLFVFLYTSLSGHGNHVHWIGITILISIFISLFIVSTVPDHFLEEHLWNHIVKIHIPRIFLWTFGTLLTIALLKNYINIEALISENMIWVLLIAVLIGIIPESGPHLIFLTLFAQGTLPFSILLASSISQDGHGMLPLLAESKRAFIAVKLVNISVALLVGYLGLMLGH
ncbi:MAG: arsenic efflux protein [Candidatus Marinimicrobia bacterium]|nr:arsenic efflux protein [Candidatus Neomarinimicrobiota bacterium]